MRAAETIESYLKSIEHWKQLDRFHFDPIFCDVVTSFEACISQPIFSENQHKRICELEMVLIELLTQLENEHVSDEFCVPIIEKANKLIQF